MAMNHPVPQTSVGKTNDPYGFTRPTRGMIRVIDTPSRSRSWADDVDMMDIDRDITTQVGTQFPPSYIPMHHSHLDTHTGYCDSDCSDALSLRSNVSNHAIGLPMLDPEMESIITRNRTMVLFSESGMCEHVSVSSSIGAQDLVYAPTGGYDITATSHQMMANVPALGTSDRQTAPAHDGSRPPEIVFDSSTGETVDELRPVRQRTSQERLEARAIRYAGGSCAKCRKGKRKVRRHGFQEYCFANTSSAPSLIVLGHRQGRPQVLAMNRPHLSSSKLKTSIRYYGPKRLTGDKDSWSNNLITNECPNFINVTDAIRRAQEPLGAFIYHNPRRPDSISYESLPVSSMPRQDESSLILGRMDHNPGGSRSHSSWEAFLVLSQERYFCASWRKDRMTHCSC